MAALLQYVFIRGIWMYVKLDYFSYALREVIPKYKKTAVVGDTLAGARDGWGPTGVIGWVAERTQIEAGCPEHCVETWWGQRRWVLGNLRLILLQRDK